MKRSTLTFIAILFGLGSVSGFAAEKNDPEAFTITKAKNAKKDSKKKLRTYERGSAHESEIQRRIASHDKK